MDKETHQTIPGAVVECLNQSPPIATATDDQGFFRLLVPVGRQSFRFSALGYESFELNSVLLNSAKELVLSVELAGVYQLGKEVEVVAHQEREKPLNEMSAVSARTFSIEEAQRYAGSVNDPGRMAAGFAGASAPKDNNNDIVVRGTSPVGMLWRLEGIDIPNPNHFARKGSTGGGISVLSASLLENGDFSTGAFAAEFGNALSGVFDLRFRKGNNEKREYIARAGLLGLDLAAEGPIGPSGGASYLANYRYSTLGILNKIGFRLVSGNVENSFQDLCFNVAMPTKSKGVFTVFGIGGKSDEVTFINSDTALWKGPTDYTASVFSTLVGAIGATHIIALGPRSYVRTVFLYGANRVGIVSDTINKQKVSTLLSDEYYTSGRQSLHTVFNYKASSRRTVRAGVLASNLFFQMRNNRLNRLNGEWVEFLNGSGNAGLIQTYLSAKERLGPRLTLYGGIHTMSFFLNRQHAIEPRFALRYQITERLSAGLAFGVHSQIQPLGNYFTVVDTGAGSYFPNQNLKFTRANHFVGSLDFLPLKNLRIKAEGYFFDLSRVPIGASLSSTFNILNERDGFASFPLISKGRQYSKGIDLTVERFFSNQYFFLLTASVFESKYKTHTSAWFNTRYNTRYNSSALLGRELKLGKKVIELGARVVYSGGLWFTPVDTTASNLLYETVRDESRPYSVQLPAYFRVDIRVAIRLNKFKRASVLAIDVQNATNKKNVFNENYDISQRKLVYFYQSGLIPVVSWRMDF